MCRRLVVRAQQAAAPPTPRADTQRVFDRRVVCRSITRSSRTDGSPSLRAPAWSSTSNAGPRSAATSWPTGSSTSPPNATALRANCTWADFGTRNRALGARLQQVTEPGDRVAILCPQNLDYLVAFFGTLYSGRIAVPLFDPSEPGHVGRLHAVLDDCQPSAILTTTEAAEGVRKFFRTRPAKERPRVIAVDAIPDEVGATWEHYRHGQRETPSPTCSTPPGPPASPPACRSPTSNLATNVVQVIEALEGEEADRGVSWLPFFHDMGLITALLPPMIGHYFTFMTPAAFVRRPIRWMREIARQPGDTGGTISVAPNFAFDHAAARGAAQGRRGAAGPVQRQGRSSTAASRSRRPPCSGSTTRSARSASRPRRSSRPTAWPRRRCSCRPPRRPRSPTIISVDRDELNAGAVRPGARRLAQGRRTGRRRQDRCGRVGGDRRPRDRHRACPTVRSARSGSAATTWAPGYWNKPEKTVETFQNILKSRTSPSHAEGAADDATWVRTGDLGAYHDGELYITGRTKDLVIIDGRNHYPQDLEFSAQEATKAVRTGFVAAFSVPANQLPDEVFADAHAGLKRDRHRHLRAVGDRRRARRRLAQDRTLQRSLTPSAPPSRSGTA